VAEILLDTTYLLPVFSVDVGLKGFKKYFPKLLVEHEVYYSPASLVEAKWIVLALVKRGVEGLLEAYRVGLRALLSDVRLRQTPLTTPEVEEVADEALKEGLKDYFDRLLFATAACLDLVLLTEDEELHELLRRWRAPKPKGALTWREAVEKLAKGGKALEGP